jgi:hypothetical protein
VTSFRSNSSTVTKPLTSNPDPGRILRLQPTGFQSGPTASDRFPLPAPLRAETCHVQPQSAQVNFVPGS